MKYFCDQCKRQCGTIECPDKFWDERSMFNEPYLVCSFCGNEGITPFNFGEYEDEKDSIWK